jgi:hypothetical protein
MLRRDRWHLVHDLTRFNAFERCCKKTGKGNRTEHGTIGPHRPKKKAQLKEVPKAEESDDPEKEFEKIPF